MVAQPTLRTTGLCVLLLAAMAVPATAQDIRFERDRFKSILRNVSKEIEKNFYDPEMKGLDWNALTDQASQRIEQANSVSDMMTAITVLVDKLKDSHTFFIPPPRPVTALFGFEAKPFGTEIRVFELKKDSAAEAAGLQLGDRIHTINGFPAERNSFDMLMLYLRHLRPVQIMDIQFSRGGGAAQRLRIQAKLKTEPIHIDLTTLDSLYRLLQEEDPEDRIYASTRSFNGGAIGCVKLKTFEISVENAHNLASGLKKSKGYIIDLRGNSGGAVEALLAFVGHFGEQPGVMGEVVTRKKTEKLELKPKGAALNGPVAVLVDSRSMSASEMFARHLQIAGRATVIGDHTLGRVNAAQVLSLQTGTDRIVPYGVEVSVGRVIFPSGEQLEGKGVTPDIACIPSSEDQHAKRDPCLLLALQSVRKALGLPAENELEIEKKEAPAKP